MSFCLLKGRFRAALCAALLLAAAAAQALDYRKPFAPTPRNLRAFWGGATRQLYTRLRAGQLLPLASPSVRQVLADRQGQNLAFIESLPEKYQREPWLFLELDPARQVEILDQSLQAASQALASKAPDVLAKARQAAEELGKSGSKTQAWHPVLARSKPALEKVSYAKTLTPAHKAVFEESLRRRKSPWYEELNRVGIDLKSPAPPRLKVRQAQARGSAGDLRFTVEWEQGKHHVGAFGAVVRQKDAMPELAKAAEPPAPLRQQLTLRFRQTILAIFKTTAEQKAAIGRFFEERKLRLLHESWEGNYTAAVTGRASAQDFARSVSGKGLVLYASPKLPEIPVSKQVHLAFRSSLVSEDDILKVLNTPGLSVLKKEPDGSYLVAARGSVSAARLSDRLLLRRAVLYAAPLTSRAPENNQLILTVKPMPLTDAPAELVPWENQVAALLAGKGLRVLEQVGLESFRVAPRGKPISSLAARLKAEPAVKTVVRVGSVPKEEIAAAIKGLEAASRGFRTSGSDFNQSNAFTRQAFVLAGATRRQLERFDKAAAEASARGEFKNYAGD